MDVSYPMYQAIGHHRYERISPVDERRNARRPTTSPIDDPMGVPPEVSPVSIPLAVLPPGFITPTTQTQVPLHIPVSSTPMVVPGAVTADVHADTDSQMIVDHTAPVVSRRRRRSARFRYRAVPAVMDTGPWHYLPPPPQLVRSVVLAGWCARRSPLCSHPINLLLDQYPRLLS